MSNQFQEEEAVMKISRSDTNQLIPSLESAYYGLLLQGKYLPKLTSSIITSDYLLGVLFEKIYVPNLEEVQIGVLLKTVKKHELIDEVSKIPIQQKIWGIDQKHTPDKDWIINVLKTLKPEHYFFQKYKQECKYDMKTFTQEQINKIKELDLSMEERQMLEDSLEYQKKNKQKHINKKSQSRKKIWKEKWRERLRTLVIKKKKYSKLKRKFKTLTEIDTYPLFYHSIDE